MAVPSAAALELEVAAFFTDARDDRGERCAFELASVEVWSRE